MTINDFNEIINKLENVWPNFYNPVRKDIIYLVAEKKSAYAFRKIVDGLISTERNAPTPSAIVELLSKVKSEGSFAGECENCSNSGWYFKNEKDDFATRCQCVGGGQALIKSLERQNFGKNDPWFDRQIEAVKRTYERY